MISFLASFFGNSFFSQVVSGLRQAYRDRLVASNNSERIKAEEDIAILNAQRDILLEEMKYGMTSWIRPAFSGIFFIYLCKTVLWDKVLGLGVTDMLSAQQEYIMYGFLGVYFIGRPLEKILGKKK